MPAVSEKKRFFLKKAGNLFANSDFVATFASAFEKNAPLHRDEEFTIRELRAGKRVVFLEKCEVFIKYAGKPKTVRNSTEPCEAMKRQPETESFFRKMFAGLKKMFYLCSPFAPRSATFFRYGSLNYWF